MWHVNHSFQVIQWKQTFLLVSSTWPSMVNIFHLTRSFRRENLYQVFQNAQPSDLPILSDLVHATRHEPICDIDYRPSMMNKKRSMLHSYSLGGKSGIHMRTDAHILSIPFYIHSCIHTHLRVTLFRGEPHA